MAKAVTPEDIAAFTTACTSSTPTWRNSWGPSAAATGHETLTAGGMLGIIIRMEDKQARIEHIAELMAEGRDDIPTEGLIDAWMDLIGYATLGYLRALDGES